MRLQLVLTDDWELRGNGSGNMRAIQFATMRQLRQIYEQFHLRASFNAEIMQQLAHLKWGQTYSHLLELAHEWEALVKETYARGHDFQLHVHPQWSDAHYENGVWTLNGDWSITRYPPQAIRQILKECRDYLEGLLRPLNPDYRCFSFRSGGWCLAPSEHILPILAELGIVFDMSMAEGLVYDLKQVQLDYRDMDEPFLPYYPQMNDARRLARGVQPIVCVPTNSFLFPWRFKLLRLAARFARHLKASPAPALRSLVYEHFRRPNDIFVCDGGYAQDYSQQVWRAQDHKATKPTRQVSDLSMLTFAEIREMLRNARARARASGWSVVPIIVGNHSKDNGYFEPIKKFAAHVAQASDWEVITLSELAQNLQAGLYPVRMAA